MTANPRLERIVQDVVGSLREVLRRHNVTEEEYRAAVAWLTEAGTQPNEIPLVCDVFLAVTLDDLNAPPTTGTENAVEGPFYTADTPFLEAPYRVPMRPDEPGERLLLSGSVRSADGSPLAGAVLDLWQVSADGGYSNFHPGFPEHNLRGRLRTDAEGRFEVETVVPVPYEVPDGGATGKLLAALGRHPWRPSHLHVKLSHEGHQPLTTQLYLAESPWLDSDVVGAVKSSLVVQLERDGSGPARCRYDFTLEPVRTPAAV